MQTRKNEQPGWWYRSSFYVGIDFFYFVLIIPHTIIYVCVAIQSSASAFAISHCESTSTTVNSDPNVKYFAKYLLVRIFYIVIGIHCWLICQIFTLIVQ